jgi:hypothetical protein
MSVRNLRLDVLAGTKTQGWQQLPFDSPFTYDQFWYILPVPGVASTYVLYNLKSGTVMDLAQGQLLYDW